MFLYETNARMKITSGSRIGGCACKGRGWYPAPEWGCTEQRIRGDEDQSTGWGRMIHANPANMCDRLNNSRWGRVQTEGGYE